MKLYLNLLNLLRRNLLVMSMLAFAAFLGTSCISNKNLVYIQDPRLETTTLQSFQTTTNQYRLHTADILSISVKGTDNEIAGLFNTTQGNMNFADPPNQFLNGYSIDETGHIQMPTIGKVMLRGLTIAEANALVQQKLNNYLREATVFVKLVSFKITVLGEVKRPGYFYISNAQCTLLEGLGLGGDLTNIGNRKRIKLVRQTLKGTDVAVLDLTSSSAITSQYYYLQPNDVIYVEPLTGQTPRANLAPVTLTLGILSGLITTTLLIINLRNR